MNQITPQQAIDTLHKAVRQLNATADVHEHLRMCFQVIAQELDKAEAAKEQTEAE